MDFIQNPKKYKKSFSHSYTLGPFPTFELLKSQPERADAVYYSESFNQKEKLENLCRDLNIPTFCSDKKLQRISDKEVLYAAAAFHKYDMTLNADAPHIVLVNPSDMGNLGTILRTALGFGILDIAVIEPGADIFHPKTVRASMGALFSMRCARFQSFEEYIGQYSGNRDMFPFMLEGGTELTPKTCPLSPCYSLIFGNEASGLPESFKNIGRPLFIPQSEMVDSLNLSIAVGIGTYLFAVTNN